MIGVRDGLALGWLAPPDRHLHRVDHELGTDVICDRPAHNATAEGVEHDGQVLNRPGIRGGSIPWNRGWSHGIRTTPSKPRSYRYSAQEKEQAVRMVRQLRRELGETRGTVQRVALQIGCGVESLRTWVNQAESDAGEQPGVTTVEAARIKELGPTRWRLGVAHAPRAPAARCAVRLPSMGFVARACVGLFGFISLGSLMYGSGRIGLALTLVSWPTWLTIHPHLFTEIRERRSDRSLTRSPAKKLNEVRKQALRWARLAWVVNVLTVVLLLFIDAKHSVLLAFGIFVVIFDTVVHLWQSELAERDGFGSAGRHPVTRMLTRLIEGLASLRKQTDGEPGGKDQETTKRKARRWFEAERGAVALALIVAMLINIGLFGGVARGEPITPGDVVGWIYSPIGGNDDKASPAKDLADTTTTTTVKQPAGTVAPHNGESTDTTTTVAAPNPGRTYATVVCGGDPEAIIGGLFTEDENTKGQVARAWEAMRPIGVNISGCPSSVTRYSTGMWFLRLTLAGEQAGGVIVDQQGRATYVDAKSVVALVEALETGTATRITGVFSTAPPVIGAPAPGRRGFAYLVEQTGGPCGLVVRIGGEQAVRLSPASPAWCSTPPPGAGTSPPSRSRTPAANSGASPCKSWATRTSASTSSP